MDKQLKAQVVFHLTGRHAEGEAAAAALEGMRPALMAAYRRLDSLRYDFPMVLAGTGDEYVHSLTAVVDAALRASAPPGVAGEALRRRALRVEAGIRRLAAAGARGTLTELPMNEVYLSDGSLNPFYDRAWAWGWGRAAGSDVASKQARGYRVVTRDELDEAVDEGKVPEHYRSLLLAVEHGSRMQYGDLVLMRIPRVLWRQLRAADEDNAKRHIKRTDEQNHAAFDQAGVKNLSGPISNELSSGLKMSGI